MSAPIAPGGRNDFAPNAGTSIKIKTTGMLRVKKSNTKNDPQYTTADTPETRS